MRWPFIIRTIAIAGLVGLSTVTWADGVSTAEMAVDLANQKVDVARREAENARRDLELAQGARRSAEDRAQGLQGTSDTLKLIQDDPRLMEQISADARTA